MGKRTKRQTLDFPQDIIYEILTNLPVKSLLRFKCVSKPWRCSISSKQFVREHLRKSNTRTDFAHHKVTINKNKRTHLYSPSVYSCSLKALLDESSSSKNFVFTNLDPWLQITKIVVSCNGLMLMVRDKKNLFLWNPSTREAKSVPRPSFACSPLTYLRFGFCYDESADDYKVVCILLDTEPYPTEMYSSRTGSWRKIAEFDKGYPCNDCDKLVNGRLHWLVYIDGDRWDIVALHMVDETYEVVGRPECFPHDDHSDPKLGNLGGDCLTLITRDRLWDTNVWVMKRYGDAKSWTRVWTLSDFIERRIYPRATPLWLKKNGDIVVAMGSIVVVHDGVDKKCKSRVDIGDATIPRPIIYVESLVSPTYVAS